MTIRDLMAKLRNVDENYTLTLQKPDGTQKDITKVSQQGDRITFWTDSAS